MQGIDGLWLILASCIAAGLLTGLSIWVCSLLRINTNKPHAVQCVHKHWAPRVGGVPIFITVALGVFFWDDASDRQIAILLLVAALPAFVAGFVEDLWDRVGPRMRLLATFVSAGLAWVLVGAQLTTLAIPGVDTVLQQYWFVAFLFTAFAVGGVAHSINIIDGFNGLSACFGVICFAAFFVIATIVGDHLVQGISLLFCGALLGFLVWNFPFGRIFLGDAGAYFLGFALAETSILIVMRNPEVSPWFCLLVMVYPIWDTLFSSYRREVVRGTSWSRADTLHLHHLIYRRLVRSFNHESGEVVMPNSITSVYLWGLSLMSAIPAVLFWDNTPVLMGFALLFAMTYCLLYRRLVRFKAPKALVIRGRRSVEREPERAPAE